MGPPPMGPPPMAQPPMAQPPMPQQPMPQPPMGPPPMAQPPMPQPPMGPPPMAQPPMGPPPMADAPSAPLPMQFGEAAPGVCSKCAFVSPPGFAFCGRCGTPLAAAPAPAADVGSAQTIFVGSAQPDAPPPLAMASTDAVPVSARDAADYVKHLLHAGYLTILKASKPGTQAIYRLTNNTGPRPPMVQRLKTVFDQNLGKIMWHEEVNA